MKIYRGIQISPEVSVTILQRLKADVFFSTEFTETRTIDLSSDPVVLTDQRFSSWSQSPSVAYEFAGATTFIEDSGEKTIYGPGPELTGFVYVIDEFVGSDISGLSRSSSADFFRNPESYLNEAKVAAKGGTEREVLSQIGERYQVMSITQTDTVMFIINCRQILPPKEVQ